MPPPTVALSPGMRLPRTSRTSEVARSASSSNRMAWRRTMARTRDAARGEARIRVEKHTSVSNA